MGAQAAPWTVKRYDEKYFRRWYHNPRSRIVTPAERARRVRMAVSVAEFVLERPVRTVLDVGCGEAPWQPVLKRLRPRVSYTGIDSSEYVCRRFGRSRNIVRGRFADLGARVPGTGFDLVVSSDVIHYLDKGELERGLPALVERIGGVCYLDFFTASDEIEGDLHQMMLRPPGYYTRLFERHGLHSIGLQFYTSAAVRSGLASMEAAP